MSDNESLKRIVERHNSFLEKEVGFYREEKKETESLYQPISLSYNELPFREIEEGERKQLEEDFLLLFEEGERGNKLLLDQYNYMHSEKRRIDQRIRNLNGLLGDFMLISKEEDGKSIYIKESFEKPESSEKIGGEALSYAQVSSIEGILTLGRKDTIDVSAFAKVVSVEGNGEAGTEHLVRRVEITDKEGNTKDGFVFISDNEQMKNNKEESLLDRRSDTIYEYQAVSVPNEFQEQYRHYNFGWIKGGKDFGLRMKVIFELEKPESLNWIHIQPYYAPYSTGRVSLYSVRTSEDGFLYQGLFDTNEVVLNQELNNTPQTYRVDSLFDGKNNFDEAKFTGQGVFAFPSRKTRFIEMIFDQKESYPEKVGQYTYWKKEADAQEYIQIPETKELAGKEVGEYPKQEGSIKMMYKKELAVTDKGTRYAIGLKDIGLMSYRFEEKSVFYSKKHEVDFEIESVMLYVNEKIPEAYTKVTKTSNDWITYEITFDDVTYYRLSPMHQEPVNDEFPPKILEINRNQVDFVEGFSVHKKKIKMDKNPTWARIRIVLSRPVEEETSTPIVEDYAIRFVKKGDIL